MGQHYYEKSAYIAEITDDVIDVVTEQVQRKTSPLSVMLTMNDSTYVNAMTSTTRSGCGPRTER